MRCPTRQEDCRNRGRWDICKFAKYVSKGKSVRSRRLEPNQIPRSHRRHLRHFCHLRLFFHLRHLSQFPNLRHVGVNSDCYLFHLIHLNHFLVCVLSAIKQSSYLGHQHQLSHLEVYSAFSPLLCVNLFVCLVGIYTVLENGTISLSDAMVLFSSIPSILYVHAKTSCGY